MQVNVLGHGELEVQEQATGLDLVNTLKLTAPGDALGMCINGVTKDLSTPLHEGDSIEILSFDTPKGKEIYWHSTAHVLAQAVLRLWPEAKPTIGPPIQEGFYYDFANLTISDADFAKIEGEVKKIIKENFKPERHIYKSKAEAEAAFTHNQYKQALIKEMEGDEEISYYTQGEFTDLCRGPHLPRLGKIKAFKILKTSGAYWRGDSRNEMLTRIYGISFPDKQGLKEYLHAVEEAKKRDHKILGPKHQLFTLKEEAPGIPFFHPKGMWIWNKLIDFWRDLHTKAGYVEIKTPLLLTQDLWVRSGHWAHYRENMYTTEVEERPFALKPMNCPGCMLYYNTEVHSYRELPLRVAEIGNVHRFEPSGALSGLFRVRGFHQDDAHIFMTPENVQEEILNMLKLAQKIYETFGMSYHFELSTRPEKDTIGTDEEWEITTQALQGALESFGAKYRINEGDGAFYGPKIDIHIQDSLKRSWQLGTIQLDMALPQRFHVEYVASDGSRKTPIVAHRALFGSLERFMGHLIEHYACRFPLWISPNQIAVIPVADRHVERAHVLRKQLTELGYNCFVDSTNESVSKKVREAQIRQTNYMLTIGDQELENSTLSIRTRDNYVVQGVKLSEFIASIEQECKTRSQESSYTKTA